MRCPSFNSTQWIDTCCIDKSSSSELSEAINSMFRYYSDAEVCYAFLSDVNPDDVAYSLPDKFKASRWFTRGWTLQELIAPGVVEFYNSKWESIGSREKLLDLVVDITGISESYFATGDLTKFSAAEKLSWAAERTTTRTEDVAYSLLGLLDINMPLLYGEGTRAFLRLQEEILRQYADDSIFAHFSFDLLAASPWWFRSEAEIKRIEGLENDSTNKALAANRKVEINRTHISMVFPVVRLEVSDDEDDEIAGWWHDNTPGVYHVALVTRDAGPATPLVLREEPPGIYTKVWVPRRTLTNLGKKPKKWVEARVELRTLCIAHRSFALTGQNGSQWRWRSNMSWEQVNERIRLTTGRKTAQSEPGMQPLPRRRPPAGEADPAVQDRAAQDLAARNKVVVKGPAAATGFQMVYVYEAWFRATWPGPDDELHLIPDMTSNVRLLAVIFSNPGKEAFMVTLQPTRASIHARLWTDIPPWEGQNPMEFMEGLNAARQGAEPCSRDVQRTAGGGTVEVQVESRRRSDGWWVYVTVAPQPGAAEGKD